jgi:nitrite reductase/ring-hydroxylating ferredoxin subunit
MKKASFAELLQLPAPGSRLQDRVLVGEYFLIRGALQHVGLFESIGEASLRAIRAQLGEAVANQVRTRGFERIHEFVSPADIPRMTDAVYQEVVKRAPAWLRRAVPALFGSDVPFYFERFPNVRFHIPYDLAAAHRRAYENFGVTYGEGKITAHGPHRDSWLQCPTNAINVWVAVGPVDEGNGMVVFPEPYTEVIGHDGGYVRQDARPGRPTRVSMQAGDALVFHGDQLHASVLNYTNLTRFAISFRLTMDRPVFADLHLHDYAYSRLAVGPFAEGPLGWVSEIPAKLQPNYITTRVRIARDKLRNVLGARTAAGRVATGPPAAVERQSAGVSTQDVGPGEIRAVDAKTCVARLSDGSLVAFGRRCTHEGADLAFGAIEADQVRCPWHGVPFDPRTGKSACTVLKALRVYPASVVNDRLVIGSLSEPA